MTSKGGSVGLLVIVVGFTVAGLVSLSLAGLRPVASELPVYDKLGGNFELSSTKEVDSLEDVRGKVALLSFGFTSCTDICPMMMDKFSKVYQVMDTAKLDHKVAMFFVTVDPARDTLDVIKEYIEKFDSRIIGLTGDQETLQKVQKNLAVMSFPITGEDQWGHSDRIFLFDTESRLRAMVTLNDSVDDMADMIQGLIAEGR